MIVLDFRFTLIPKGRIFPVSVKTLEQQGREACIQLQAYFLGCHPEICLERISQFTSSVDHESASNIWTKDMPVWRSWRSCSLQDSFYCYELENPQKDKDGILLSHPFWWILLSDKVNFEVRMQRHPANGHQPQQTVTRPQELPWEFGLLLCWDNLPTERGEDVRFQLMAK